MCLVSPKDNGTFSYATFYLILSLVFRSGSPFNSYCFKHIFFFLFSNTQSCCEMSLRSWKVLFKPEVFAVFTFQLARWISVGQSRERKGFLTRLLTPRSSSCLSLLQFSHNWLSCAAAKRRRIKCKLRSHSLSWYISGTLVETLLCLGFWQLFEKCEIGAFCLVLSELETVRSCSVMSRKATPWIHDPQQSRVLTCDLSDLHFLCCIYM